MRLLTKRQEINLRGNEYLKGYQDGASFARRIANIEKAQFAVGIVLVAIVVYVRIHSDE